MLQEGYDMKKVKIQRLIAVSFLAGLIVAGILLWRSFHNKAPGSDLVLYGNIDIRQVELAFNGNERISLMSAEEGTRVEKGQLLATLETDRLTHEVAHAEAQVRAQREVVARYQSGSRPEEIRKARADVKAAEAEAVNAETNYNRFKYLSEKGSVSLQQRDNAQTTADSSRQKLQAVKEILDLTVKGPRKEDIAVAKATLKAYEAALALAQKKLTDTNLYAPSAGVIRNRIMEPGDMASPQKPVYTLALTDPVWVRTYIPETDLGKIKIGMSAQVSTDSYPDKHYKGWVGFISPTAEFTPKSVETREVRTKLVYQARVYVCNPQNELRLGMPSTVTLSLNQTLKETATEDRCKNP
jgi:HlyD family secretion protein